MLATVTLSVYLGDRWVDSRRSPKGVELPIRYFVAREAPLVVLAMLGICISFSVYKAIQILPSERLFDALLLGALLLAYLALAHVFPRVFRVLLAREFMIGLFFALALGFLLPAEQRMEPGLFLFALLCAANAHAVSFAERDLDQALGIASTARFLPPSLRTDLLFLLGVLIAVVITETPFRAELMTAAALEFFLFLRLGPCRSSVILADLPLYGTAMAFLAFS